MSALWYRTALQVAPPAILMCEILSAQLPPMPMGRLPQLVQSVPYVHV